MRNFVAFAWLVAVACQSVIGGNFEEASGRRASGPALAAGNGGDAGAREQRSDAAGAGAAGATAEDAGAGTSPPLDNPDWSLPAVVEGCDGHPDHFDAVQLSFASSLAVFPSSDTTTQLTAFAVDALSPLVAVRWIYQGTSWTDWGCFDAVPEPSRVAAMLVTGGVQELFVTTQHGSLFSRTLAPEGWTLWTTSARPTLPARARDVAAWGGGAAPAQVLLATSEGLYAKSFVEPDGAGRNGYGPWRRIDAAVYDRVTLCGARAAHGFGLRGGRLYAFDLEQPSAELVPNVDIAGLSDLECVQARGGEVALYLVNGGLLRVVLDGDGSAGEPTEIGSPGVVSSVTALPRPDAPDYLFTTDGAGHTLLSPDGGESWLTDVW